MEFVFWHPSLRVATMNTETQKREARERDSSKPNKARALETSSAVTRMVAPLFARS
jgi:hypothetical protein